MLINLVLIKVLKTMKRESFVTLATNDEYCIGALVLCVSLRQVQTQKEITIIHSNDVSFSMR